MIIVAITTITMIVSFVMSVYIKLKSDNRKSSIVAFGRDEATRTPDPYVPNVVRYQLRYIPKAS